MSLSPPPMPGPPDASLIPAPLSATVMSTAKSFAYVALALQVVATLVFSMRMWTRSVPVFRMQADDYVCAIAFVLVTVENGLLLATIPYAFGRDPSTFTLADVEMSYKFATIAQPFWSWGMSTIKISIALMLLRLERKKFWRRFLWVMIVVQVLLGAYNMFAQLLQCIPLRKAWDLLGTEEGNCWGLNALRISSICVSTINILTDFIFALLPISFLRKVQRPLRERAIIGMLMALGIFAGVASIIKIEVAVKLGDSDDLLNEAIQAGMWSSLETLAGLIAACVPCLRSPFQQALEYLGLVSTHTHKSSYGPGYGQMYGESGMTRGTKGRMSGGGVGARGSSGIKMKSLNKSLDAQSEENILGDDADGGKTGEIWCTTEVLVADEARQSHKQGLGDNGGRSDAIWSDEIVRCIERT